MTIDDSCPCGAKFHINIWDHRQGGEFYVMWVNMHRNHRDDNREVELVET